MSWSDKYVGGEYAEKGRGPIAWDCFGLFMRVQKQEFGVDVPDIEYGDVFKDQRNKWSKVTTGLATAGDAILINLDGKRLHIACAIDANNMIHAHHSCGVSVERFNSVIWRNRIMGIYRHVG